MNFDSPKLYLTRFEIARVVGLRAVQLDTGSPPTVYVTDPILKNDGVYVAALELYRGTRDARIRRMDGSSFHVRDARAAPDLTALLDTKDGGNRTAVRFATPET